MNIDPNVLNIILGLTTNGLGSLIALSGRKVGKLLSGEQSLEKWQNENEVLEPHLLEAIKGVAEHIEWRGGIREEIIALFLLSPEVEEIVRQVYSTKLAKEEEITNIKAIRKIFLTLFFQFVSSYPDTEFQEDQLEEAADFLFEALMRGCDLFLDQAIHEGALTAHEAKTAFRHNIIYSEIKVLQKKLNFLIASPTIDIQAIFTFEEQYRQQVGRRHGYITPPNFDAVRKIPIDNLYVHPKIFPAKERQKEREVFDTNSFFSRMYRAVLLGNPGGGKSTLTLKLCYDLAIHSTERLVAGRSHLTPILVVLRDYATNKKSHQWSILEFIEIEAKSHYQLPAPPKGTFEYLLLNGRALVIFDGLDELLDTSYRQEISNDIESFCHLYPSVPVLVTSREVGYEQSPLNEEMFEVYRLASFDEGQVQEYVEKWFNVAYGDRSLKLRQTKAESFLRESQIVPDLRSNPLMLALMCNIYRGENYIPRNRPDVYEKCATMLYDRWDRSRDIHVVLPFEAHINPTIKYLAHWIYTDERLRTGVTEEKLIAKTAEYLCQKRFEDSDEASRAAQEFVRFCRGRGWVFTDIGTTKEGERLYQFTHQTFLEYFTAAYLVRTHPTPDTLIHVLLPKIVRGESDVVVTLAFQIQNRSLEDAGDELLTMLIEQSRKAEEEEKWNLLFFAARCLTFIVPSPKVTRDIAVACVEHIFLLGIVLLDKWGAAGDIDSDKPEKLLTLLFSSLSENRPTVVDAFESFLANKFNNGSEQDAFLALEICIMASVRVDHIFDRCPERTLLLCPKVLLVCNRAFFHGKVTVEDFIEWHGVSNLFRVCLHVIRRNSYSLPPASIIIKDVFLLNTLKQSRSLQALRSVGHILPSYPLPWIKQAYLYECILSFPHQIFKAFYTSEKMTDTPQAWHADELFGAFLLCAVWLEAQDLSEQAIYINMLKTKVLPLFGLMRWILIAHFEPVTLDKIQAEFDNCKFTAEQQHFIQQWLRREVSLVE